MKIAYKLVRLRENGTLGPLFIDKSRVLSIGKWLNAEEKPTKGFAFWPGWHCCANPIAPHLSMNGRVWCKIQIKNFDKHLRPERQGGLWFTAKQMKIVEIL